jgi:hypothetical protein
MSIIVNNFEITKSLVRDLGNLNSLHDLTADFAKADVIPTLLTSMFSPSETFLQTNIFEFDFTTYNQSMPTDKQYSERGIVQNDRKTTKTHLFQVPSFGMQNFVRPQDVLKRRKAGTDNVLETMEAVVLEDMAAMRKGWALLAEKAIAHSIVTGTLYVPNSTVAAVDFYQEFTGVPASSRPSVDFKLGTPTEYPRDAGEAARSLILDNLLEGQTVEGFIALCGRAFFNKRIKHIKEEQVYPNRQGIDEQDPLIKRLGLFANTYRKYRGADDILYISIESKIGGSSLIPDNECYIMPVGTAGIFSKYYAPSQTMEYVNSVAQREYMWRQDSTFDGVRMFMESNFGMFLINPNLIVKGTSST